MGSHEPRVDAIDWEHLNECDTVSETILLRDRLRAKLAGEPWQYPGSTI